MGGEIFTHLRKAGDFEEPHAKFYAATVLCALEHMHERCIVYRDLKPENLVLDDQVRARRDKPPPCVACCLVLLVLLLLGVAWCRLVLLSAVVVDVVVAVVAIAVASRTALTSP